MPGRSKKLCRAFAPNIAPDPMVDAGNPAHRHQTRTAPHPTRTRHRVVTLAPRPPSPSAPRSSQNENATVMLILEALNLFFVAGIVVRSTNRKRKPKTHLPLGVPILFIAICLLTASVGMRINSQIYEVEMRSNGVH
jgi:hypothetical protein